MIAVDSSSLRRYFLGVDDRDTRIVRDALVHRHLYVPPAVISEVFSDPSLPIEDAETIMRLPLLKVRPGYWKRAGVLRSGYVRAKLKARLPDCLIAQSCLDYDLPLLTFDRDFRHFVPVGLRLA